MQSPRKRIRDDLSHKKKRRVYTKGNPKYNPNFFHNLKNMQMNRTLPMVRQYASHLKKGPPTKTVDITFQAAIARPYVVDLNVPTVINIDTTGLIQNLCVIQQGNGEWNRLGNKISLKSLRIRLELFGGYNVYISASQARFLIIYDRQPNGAYPTLTNMLSTIRQDGTPVNGTLFSNININLFERFIVLMDEFVTLPPFQSGALLDTSEMTVTAQSSFTIDRYLKLKNLETVFSTTTAPLPISNVQTGALYVVSYGDVAQGSEPWSWKGEMRLRFKDC